jgi:hypothetical protein
VRVERFVTLVADHQHDPLDIEALEHPLNHRQQRGGFGHIPFEDLLGDRKTLSGLNKTECELALDSIALAASLGSDIIFDFRLAARLDRGDVV